MAKGKETKKIAWTQHFARGYKVSSNAHQQMCHFGVPGKDSRRMTEDKWVAHDSPDDLFNAPLSAKLTAAAALPGREGYVVARGFGAYGVKGIGRE